MKHELHGVIPAMVTPFLADGQHVDFASLGPVCDFLLERDVNGLFALGSTGEGALLQLDERKQVLEHILKHVDGRVAVIANCGDVTTHGSIELIQHAARVGADAASIVYPYYYPLHAQDIITHFVTVASSVPDLPVYLYYYRQGLEPQDTLRVTQAAPNVVGMKEGCGDYRSLIGHVMTMGASFSVLEGSEIMAFSALTLGASGLISGVAAAVPEPFIQLYRHVQQGQIDEARHIQRTIYHLAQAFYGRNPWGMIKQALLMRGINAGPNCAPIGPCPAESIESLRTVLREADLL